MIAWFARNGVAANLLMVLIFGAGFHAASSRTPLEVFPSFELDLVTIAVPFRGATPTESEEGVVLRIEEAIYDIEGIKKIIATAAEGAGIVTVEVEQGYAPRELLDEIKNRVDAISTFPADAERPTYELAARKREVIAVGISGDLPERRLRALGERVRDDLVNLPDVSQVELQEVRDYEISIEIPANTLEALGLTLQEVAAAVQRSSLDLAAGAIRTRGGEVLIRTLGQAYTEREFERIVVRSREDGTQLLLRDIAVVNDGFEEDPLRSLFNGRPGVLIEVYRTGDQSAIQVADAVFAYVERMRPTLPPGVGIETWRDRSRIVKARLATLTGSAVQGLILVFLLLALFLRFSVAVWVCIGIPISFMGALILMPELGVTFNIVSLFAFILVLGIVVDDAIVTGESIYTRLKTARDPLDAAIRGTHDVAVPVTFGVLTTAVAFVPILFIEGARGQIFAQIPMIVIPVLLFSLVESKLILPAHMKHIRVRGDRPEDHGAVVRAQMAFADGFERLIARVHGPLLRTALKHRYVTMALFVAGLVIIHAIVSSGAVRFVFFPRVQSETARATLTMPAGTAFEVTQGHIERMTAAAQELKAEYIDPETNESIVLNILSTVGASDGDTRGSHVGRVMFEIVSPEQRSLKITSSDLVQEWRRRIGPIPGAQEVGFRAEIGRAGNPLEVELSGADFARLEAAAAKVQERLASYQGVFDIGNSMSDGKREIRLRLKPEAELLGITLEQLARQVRAAFFGIEAQRIQRGREDVRVMVRYPESERRTLATLERMLIRAPGGADVPFSEVAQAEYTRGYDSIRRVDRRRVIRVYSDVDKQNTDIEALKADLQAYVAELLQEYPGLQGRLAGEAEEQQESFASLRAGLMLVLFAIYALLAIPLKSYGQPLIVMSVIPFGAIGAVLGHIALGMDLSILSFMGMLALVGVVVNDSLVLVDYVNQRRAEGMPVFDAVNTAGVARFRAVMLTSLTTFAGVTPLLLDETTQAQFLIPMGVSLGFGVLFATLITLVLVPVNYLVLEDIKGVFSGRGLVQENPGQA